jgi:DNA primase
VVKIEKQGGKELAKVLHYYGLLEGDSEFKIVCPFHGDVNASLLIDLEAGNFFCFGCGRTGDALKFVQYVNKDMDELEACIKYYKILHSKKVRKMHINIHKKERIESKQAIIEAKDYYYGLKSIDWRKENSAEKAYMKQRGFTAKALNECKAKINYNVAYPIIFPMFDLGEFKGWVCRTNNKRVEKKRKYLYNEGFSRSNTLVGDYDSKVVVLVEGYMDRLKFIQFGAKKVAAILGWKITDEQIKKLQKQGVKCVVSALDNDECGRKGTAYLKKFFPVIRFQYPEGVKDPGEMDQATFDKANKKTLKLYRRFQNGIS